MFFPGYLLFQRVGRGSDAIPSLTYEQFLDFHRRYYHPSNSFILFIWGYGHGGKIRLAGPRILQAGMTDSRWIPPSICRSPSRSLLSVRFTIPSQTEPEEQATYLSVNTVVGDDLDPIHWLAFQILEYTLIDAPGALLKEELVKAGIGQDILWRL